MSNTLQNNLFYNYIILNNDIIFYIIKYININKKILLSIVFNKSFLRFYDFTNFLYYNKRLSDIILIKYSPIYNYKNYINFKFIASKSKYSYLLIDKYIQDTIFDVNVIILFDIIENLDYNIIYNKNLNIFSFNYDIDYIWTTNIEKYYLDNIDNINVFCCRCGLFGHNYKSTECLLYNEFTKTLNFINTDIKDIISIRYSNIHKKCNCCKINICNIKCMYKYCNKCCNNINCLFHFKPISII